MRKETAMRTKVVLLAFASGLAGCQYTPHDLADRGVAAVNVPVVSRSDYVFDVSAPGGMLSPSDTARLDGWFRTLGVGYGDTIYVDGGDAPSVRSDVARVAGGYGLLVNEGSPITAGPVPAGMVRIVVVRSVASVPGCPNWDTPAQPNYNNRTMSNYGCSVNSNLIAQVASPEDLVRGRAAASAGDVIAGGKAINLYRNWQLTGVLPGQTERPLKSVESTTTRGAR
jgi:pilus assembly protein CpaD